VGCRVAIHRGLPNTAAPVVAVNHRTEVNTAPAQAELPAANKQAVCTPVRVVALPLPSARIIDLNISPAAGVEAVRTLGEVVAVVHTQAEGVARTQAASMPVPVAAGVAARKQVVGAPRLAVRHIHSKTVRLHRVVHYTWSNSLLSTFPYSGVNVNAVREAKNCSKAKSHR